jgi:hypothetical protein
LRKLRDWNAIAKMMIARIKRKYLLVLLILGVTLATGCAPKNLSAVSADFSFVMDTRSAEAGTANNVHIKINAKGEGQYDYYDTRGAIRYDLNHIVTYQADQVLKSGKFKLSQAELEQLWQAVNQNNFFELRGDYRMEMGLSYAFVMIQADGQRHIVDNIGMEVPEMRAIVEATDAIVPEDVHLEYGEGFTP